MRNLLWFSEIGIADVAVVGGKNASLGEMTQALASSGVSVPAGFAATAGAYRDFLHENDLIRPMGALIERYHRDEIPLSEAGGSIRSLILEGSLGES